MVDVLTDIFRIFAAERALNNNFKSFSGAMTSVAKHLKVTNRLTKRCHHVKKMKIPSKVSASVCYNQLIDHG